MTETTILLAAVILIALAAVVLSIRYLMRDCGEYVSHGIVTRSVAVVDTAERKAWWRWHYERVPVEIRTPAEPVVCPYFNPFPKSAERMPQA